MNLLSTIRPNRRTGDRAFSLTEMIVAVAGATILMAMAMSLYIFGLRSFNAIGNYTSMDSKSRMALDLMLKEIRQASKVIGYQTNGTTRWLKVATTIPSNVTNTFTWDTSTSLFTWDKTGQATKTLLVGCTNWTFACFLRAPTTTNTFAPTTDTTRTKLINMSWSCVRTNVFKKNTESIVTAEVVLRNLQE